MKGIYIDKVSIEKLLKDFHTLTGIRIAFLAPGQGELICVGKSMCPFCVVLREDAAAYAKCVACDEAAFQKAAQSGSLYLYKCHAGLTEAVAPINLPGSGLIGFLMLGQVLDTPPTEDLWKHIQLSCRQYHLDFEALKTTFYQLPYYDFEKIKAAAAIMEMASKTLYHNDLVKLRYHTTVERLKTYIEENARQPITIQDLSTAVGLSASYVSSLLKSSMDTTFTRYLMKCRIEIAKKYLLETNTHMEAIAQLSGFTDPNYFARAFKRATNLTPSQYRQSQ